MEKTRILVADNDPDHLKIMRDFLKRKGYAVVVARNVPQAKQVLQDQAVDLALLDVRLTNDDDSRDFSGLTLAELAPGIPKVVLTRYPNYLTVRMALRRAGSVGPVAVDFVSKPQGLAAIQRAVEGAVRNAFKASEFSTFFDHLQSGDREAWKRLWNKEAWRLITLVQRHGFSRRVAQDVCFEVFRDLAQAKRPPRNNTLKITLVNETVRKINVLATKSPGKTGTRRRAALRKSAESPVSPELQEDIVAPVVNDNVSKDRLIREVRQAIADLSTNEQKAILMHLFKTMSPEQIATKLGVKQTTVNRYLRKASDQLKERVGKLKVKESR